MNCVCENCKHFIQHYVYKGGFFEKVGCGECGKEPTKKITFRKKKCEDFLQKEDERQDFDDFKKVCMDLADKGYTIENILKFLNEFNPKFK